MTLVPSGHVPVAAGAGEGAVDVLVPDDAPLAAVLAELELPATVVSELVGGDASSDAQDPTRVLRSPAGRALSPGALVGSGGATSENSADHALDRLTARLAQPDIPAALREELQPLVDQAPNAHVKRHAKIPWEGSMTERLKLDLQLAEANRVARN